MKKKKTNSYLWKKLVESSGLNWILRDGVIKILRINDDKVDQLVDEGKLRIGIDIFHDNRILYSLKDIATILNESFSDTLKSAIKLGLKMMSNYGVISQNMPKLP